MALAYTNITLELREISLKNRPKQLYDISSKGTVPVLQLNNSSVIDESIEIMYWCLDRKDPKGWMKQNKNQQIELVKLFDDKFKFWLDRYKYHDRYPEHDRKYYFNKSDQYLSGIESRLKENNYIFSSNILFVDVAIFPFIRQFANVDYSFFKNKYSNLTNWLESMMNLDLFLSVMNKYDEFIPGQEPFIVNFNQNI